MNPRTRFELQPMAGLALVVVLGFALRAIAINDQPLWGDEALTLMIAQWPFATLFLTPNDPTPGLYYAIHKALIGPDAGVVAARSISLAAGTALIAVTYGWAKECRIPALPAAVFTAVCFALVDYSQEARAYSLLVLLVSLSGWAFVRWTTGRSTLALMCFGACLLLAFYTHFVAVFWIAPMIAASFIVTRNEPAGRRRLEWMICVLAVLAVPEANRLIRYPTPNFSWLGQAGPAEAINVTSYVLLPFGMFENGLWKLGQRLAAIAGLLCYFIIGWLAYRHRRPLIAWARQNPAATMCLIVSIALPPAMWLFGYVRQPVFMPRTILIAAPGFFILLSLILSLESQIVRRLVLAVYALNLLVTGTVREKENWKSVSQVLASKVRKGDVILLCPGWKAYAMRHAMDQKLNAPLLLELNGRIMLIESPMGHDPNWVHSYFVAMTQRRGFDEGRRAIASAKRTWRVTSGC